MINATYSSAGSLVYFVKHLVSWNSATHDENNRDFSFLQPWETTGLGFCHQGEYSGTSLHLPEAVKYLLIQKLNRCPAESESPSSVLTLS